MSLGSVRGILAERSQAPYRLWPFPTLLGVILIACAGGEVPDSGMFSVPSIKSTFDPTSLAGRSYNLDDLQAATGITISRFNESPMIRRRVEAAELPPLEERLPDNPLVVIPWQDYGEYGGLFRYTSNSMLGDHYMRHFNEVRLLELRPQPESTPITKWILGTLEPGVFEHWEQNDDATVLTFRIRRGLKWSDGAPVVTEDVRFCIEDVVLDEEIYAVPEDWSRWGGEPVQVEIVDGRTFRLRFAKPYGLFIQRLVMWRWWWLMLPSHYLKQFHRDYRPLAELAPRMAEHGYEPPEWARWYKFVFSRAWGVESFVPGRLPDVERYPTLDPWLHVEQPNPGDFVWERNPYYYKIDAQGNQLPYIDGMMKLFVTDMQVTNLKIIAGETDFQYQLLLSDYPLLKKNEEAGNYRVLLLPDSQDYRIIFPLNLSPKDPVLKEIMRDIRFRRALSLALNRDEIRDVLLMGFGRPAQLAPLPGTPWYREEFASAYAEYDIEKANELLDEMGLEWDADGEFRLRRDGERLVIRLDVPTGQTEWVSGAELAREYWRALGIDLLVKPTGIYGEMQRANKVHMTAWWANAAVPVDHVFISGNMATPLWQQWNQTRGDKGEMPPDWMRSVYEKRTALYEAPTAVERTRIGIEIFELSTSHLWAIGTVAETPVPFVISRDLRNVAIAEEWRMHGTATLDAAEQWFFSGHRRGSTASVD